MIEYKIEYVGPGYDDGGNEIRVKNQGYRIYELTWQSHKAGKLVQNKEPRYKFISVHKTEGKARKAIEKLKNSYGKGGTESNS